MFLINIALRLFVVIGKVPVQTINNIQEYDSANWISLTISPLFYFGSVYLIKNFERSRKSIIIAHGFALAFCLFLMITTMRSTFFVMHNPRNTFVMYFMGMIVTAVFFTLEYYETLFLVTVTGICFAAILPYYQSEFNELLMNNLGSIILLIVFFTTSRYAYSYRVDNFLKLKFIEEKNLEIENASVIKNEILGIVAHDLRNPLAAIKTIAMIMEDDKKLDADNQDNLKMIKSACDKAASIINDLLETANNEISEFDIESTELNQFLQKVVDDWKRNTTTQVNILYYGTPEPVYGGINAEKMQRVMDNLISNAIKFSGEGNIEVSLQALDSQIIINVRDFGMGIPNELLPYIFDRFSKASRTGIRGEESVGLGLSIVRQIVKKHGGEIEVDSIEKRGTTFTIKLMNTAA